MCIRDSSKGVLNMMMMSFGSMATIGAVSYTHLDVYKRQVLLTLILVLVVLASVTASARIAIVGFGRHDVTELVGEQLRWLEPRVGTLAAVSYTHLDDGRLRPRHWGTAARPR